MEIRKYIPADCAEIITLFRETVHCVNAGDYTAVELDAWAPRNIDAAAWNEAFLSSYSLIAAEDGIIVGFGNIYEDGYLDKLYVHKDFQGLGIATELCSRLESNLSAEFISVHSSVTARRFFEKRGYIATEKQTAVRNGVNLTYYIMEKHNFKSTD